MHKRNRYSINKKLENKIIQYMISMKQSGAIPGMSAVKFEVRMSSSSASIYIKLFHSFNEDLAPSTMRISNHATKLPIKEQYIVGNGSVSWSYLKKRIRVMVVKFIRASQHVTLESIKKKGDKS